MDIKKIEKYVYSYRMWKKLPVHSNRAENPSPMHELSHSVKTLGGKRRVERGKLVAKLCEL